MSGIRIAALADLHLGFTAYNASVDGRNAREVDVEQAWSRAVDLCIAEKPDLVTIAGDVFHVLRPSMHALLAFRDGCRALSEAGITVVAVPGNHEAAKSASTKTPIVLPNDLPGIHCVTDHATLHFDIRGQRVAVRCAPHVTLASQDDARPAEPDPSADINLLLMHAAVRSSLRPNALPYHYAGKFAPDVAKIAFGFDAVLLGDYHEFTQLVPGQSVFYSGSIERTSSNIWIERAPKGVVFLDTERPGELDLRPIPTRQMYSINLVEDMGEVPTAETVNEHMENALTDDTVKDSIFRLFVPGFPREERHNIDRKLERQLKAHALHFQLDLRADAQDADVSTSAALRAGKSLTEAAREHAAQYRPEVQKAFLALLNIDGTPDDLDDPETVPLIFRKAS